MILGALASALLALGASRASSNSSSGLGLGLAAGPKATALYSLKLVEPGPSADYLTLGPSDTSASTGLLTGEPSAHAEGYELKIFYRDSAGNEFTLIKPLSGEPASIQARLSQSFWEQKLEPLLRSIGALFTISLER